MRVPPLVDRARHLRLARQWAADDAGTPADAGTPDDAGTPADAGAPADASTDAGASTSDDDAGAPADPSADAPSGDDRARPDDHLATRHRGAG